MWSTFISYQFNVDSIFQTIYDPRSWSIQQNFQNTYNHLFGCEFLLSFTCLTNHRFYIVSCIFPKFKNVTSPLFCFHFSWVEWRRVDTFHIWLYKVVNFVLNGILAAKSYLTFFLFRKKNSQCWCYFMGRSQQHDRIFSVIISICLVNQKFNL